MDDPLEDNEEFEISDSNIDVENTPTKTSETNHQQSQKTSPTQNAQSNRKRLFPSPRKNLKRSKADDSIRQTVSMATEALSTMNNIFAQKKEKTDDEFDLFGQQIALKIRKLPSERVRNIVQYKINTVIFDAEMGSFNYTDSTCTSQSSVSYQPFSAQRPSYNMNPYPATNTSSRSPTNSFASGHTGSLNSPLYVNTTSPVNFETAPSSSVSANDDLQEYMANNYQTPM